MSSINDVRIQPGLVEPNALPIWTKTLFLAVWEKYVSTTLFRCYTKAETDIQPQCYQDIKRAVRNLTVGLPTATFVRRTTL